MPTLKLGNVLLSLSVIFFLLYFTAVVVQVKVQFEVRFQSLQDQEEDVVRFIVEEKDKHNESSRATDNTYLSPSKEPDVTNNRGGRCLFVGFFNSGLGCRPDSYVKVIIQPLCRQLDKEINMGVIMLVF